MFTAETEGALPIPVPLIAVRNDRLRRVSAHVSSGIQHAKDLAGERKDIVELARLAGHGPSNRPDEAAREERYRA